MPADPSTAPLDFDRHFRRAVWIAMILTFVGGGLIYSWKAQDDRSAFVRWRHQVLQLFEGDLAVYERMYFPNPPIMPITLYPLMAMPKVAGAVVWYFLKAGMTAVAAWLCFRMVRPGGKALPSYIQAGALILSLRPILSDLHHGNINLLILFLIVLTLYAWRNGYDILAGLVLALAISYKVTPGLFLPYFIYKRSWRTVLACCVGLGLDLIVVPTLVLGLKFNADCLMAWFRNIISPYVLQAEIKGPAEINQSLSAVLTRLLADVRVGGRYDPHLQVNLVDLGPRQVGLVVKSVMLGLVALLAAFCRTPTKNRFDPRLLGEFSLVVLTMLFVSERSWKHHYVTMLLPYTYLVYRVGVARWTPAVRGGLAAALLLSGLLMASTSSEVGGQFHRGQGHELAQAYGMFCWAGFVIYAATAACVLRELRDDPFAEAKAAGPSGLPGPHDRPVAAREARRQPTH